MNLPVYDPAVLPALRDLLYARPVLGALPPYELAAGLYVLDYLSYAPDEGAVWGALEALDVEREVAEDVARHRP